MEAAADVLAPEGIAALASFVIRPPRATYSRRDLGEKHFGVEDVKCVREDVELVNSRGIKLQCSYFEAVSGGASKASTPAPAVVYLHGNGSCRVEATMLLPHVLPYGISLFAFDFSGSGKSEGEYITLGVHEKEDVATVVRYLTTQRRCPKVALWGHSMGAATALMYTGLCDGASVAALVVDSAFQSFDKLAEAMVNEMPLPAAVPRRVVLTFGVRAVRKNVRERAGFDVYDIDPLGAVRKLNGAEAPPAFFLHGELDTIVPSTHSRVLCDAYPAKKELHFLPGHAHDSPRPDNVLERIFEFLQAALAPDGTAGQQYPLRLKQRGNNCMLAGRYEDASFLYSKALDALSLHAENVVADFATATGQAPIPKPTTAASIKQDQPRSLSPGNFRHIFAPRTSTASATGPDSKADAQENGNPRANGAQPRRRWRNRFTRRSDAAPPASTPQSPMSGALSDGNLPTSTSHHQNVDFDEGDSALSAGSACRLRRSDPASSPVKATRARSFLMGLRARLGRNDNGKRRSRSGRFPNRFSNYGDRRDEFRSMGSGTDMRRSDVLNRATRGASPSMSRRTSQDQSGVLQSDDDFQPRKSLGRFRRMSQSPSLVRLGEHFSSNSTNANAHPNGNGAATRVPRFSHDGWRRLRRPGSGTARNDSNSTLGARPLDSYPSIADWQLDDAQKQVALALLGNRSLARRKLGDADLALADALLCLQLDNKWIRGHLRHAAALRQAGRIEEALKATEQGLLIAPDNQQLRELRVHISELLDGEDNAHKPQSQTPPHNLHNIAVSS